MHSRIVACCTALTVLAALAIPGRVTAQHAKSAPYPYILIDLGTFGGPQANATGNPNRALTNSGLVTGAAETTMLDPYFPNGDPSVNNGDPYVQHTFLWHRGVLTDMGALGAQPTNNTSYAGGTNAINERGDIAGLSENGITDTVIGYQETHAVLWARGQRIDLGTLGGNESQGWSVNNADQVVGMAADAVPDPLSIVGWGTQTRAFVWQHGVMQDLGTLGGPDAIAFLNNDRGQVAGISYTDAITNPVTGQPTTHPFLWQHGHLQDLGTLGGSVPAFGGVNDLNSRGEVAGQSDLLGDLTYHPYLWDGHALRDLGTLGGDDGFATALNAAGDVVGRADLPGSQTHRAFLWRHGVMTNLGTFPGQTCTTAYSINASDQVVGDSGICGVGGGPAFLWQHGVLSALQSLAAPSDLQVTEAWEINERGEIVGKGVLPNGDQHTVLMIPSGLAAGEGLTSNAPAPGTTGPATGMHPSPTTCTMGPAWRTPWAHGSDRPCRGA